MSSRILFVTYSSEWTGPSNSLVQLLRHLKHRYDVSVLLPGEGPLCTKLEDEGIRYHSFPALTKSRLPAMVKLIRSERANLVYANNTHGSSRLAFVAARIAGIPFICHVRGIGWHKGWVSLGYLQLAHAVNAVSYACAASVERFVQPGRLHVIHNGVPLETGKRAPDGGSSDRVPGLPRDAFVILSVSHVCERKAQEYAVAAMPAVLREVSAAHLVLVGSLGRDPAYVRRLNSQIQTLGIGDKVHLLGFDSEVEARLNGADVFVHTAIADPHPRSVIEAMAARLPVVAFAVDGVAETVVDGETGHLIEPKNSESLAAALVQVARDAPMRERMGSAGRQRVVDHFSDVATADKVDDVIRGVLEEDDVRGPLKASAGRAMAVLHRNLARRKAGRGSV